MEKFVEVPQAAWPKTDAMNVAGQLTPLVSLNKAFLNPYLPDTQAASSKKRPYLNPYFWGGGYVRGS